MSAQKQAGPPPETGQLVEGSSARTEGGFVGWRERGNRAGPRRRGRRGKRRAAKRVRAAGSLESVRHSPSSLLPPRPQERRPSFQDPFPNNEATVGRPGGRVNTILNISCFTFHESGCRPLFLRRFGFPGLAGAAGAGKAEQDFPPPPPNDCSVNQPGGFAMCTQVPKQDRPPRPMRAAVPTVRVLRTPNPLRRGDRDFQRK